MDQAAERYLKQLRRCLICPKRDRERLAADARDMLENFAQENPGAFYKEYVDSFGAPEDFAAEMLSSLDPEDMAEARTRRRRALVGAVTAAGVLLVLAVGFWFGRQSQGGPGAEPPAPTGAGAPAPTGTGTLPPRAEPTPTPPPAQEPSAEPTAEAGPEESGVPGGDWEAYLDRVCPADSGEIVNRRAAATLMKLGVMSGNEEGEFGPEKRVTRGEAARFVTLIMCGGKDWDSGVKEESSFSDIQGHWAEAYIEYCYDLGIVFDQGDGQFRPNEEITTLELMRMILCMLGYEAEAYRLNGEDWTVRTDQLARVTNPSLYEGEGEFELDTPVTRDDTARFFFNALRCTTIRVAPSYDVATGTVTWQYTMGVKDDGTPASLLWLRFGLDSVNEIDFD